MLFDTMLDPLDKSLNVLNFVEYRNIYEHLRHDCHRLATLVAVNGAQDQQRTSTFTSSGINQSSKFQAEDQDSDLVDCPAGH
jgi:hypothetical protein